MLVIPSLEQVLQSQKSSPWELGNKFLYDLCSLNPGHVTDKEVIAKTWLIGRAYAVALERRKNRLSSSEINDSFYIDTVAPHFRNSKLDSVLNNLRILEADAMDSLPTILQAHCYLTTLLFDITHLYKRSFSSKYLHFHLPSLFYIYDSRAVEAIRGFVRGVPKHLQHILNIGGIDKEYATFYCKCYHLQQLIQSHYDISLTTRQVDNMLVEIANYNMAKKL